MNKRYIALFLIAVSAVSCKKARTCNCVTKQNSQYFNQTVNSKATTPKMTKKEAADYCNSLDVQQNAGVQQSVDCELD